MTVRNVLLTLVIVEVLNNQDILALLKDQKQ